MNVCIKKSIKVKWKGHYKWCNLYKLVQKTALLKLHIPCLTVIKSSQIIVLINKGLSHSLFSSLSLLIPLPPPLLLRHHHHHRPQSQFLQAWPPHYQ